jgi:hypothetical protein
VIDAHEVFVKHALVGEKVQTLINQSLVGARTKKPMSLKNRTRCRPVELVKKVCNWNFVGWE